MVQPIEIVGAEFGGALTFVALAGIQHRLKYSDPLEGLRRMGLVFMVAGLVSLAFLSFSSLRIGCRVVLAEHRAQPRSSLEP